MRWFFKYATKYQKAQLNAIEWKTWEAAIYDKQTWKIIGRCWISRIEDDTALFELWYWISEEYYWKWIMPECVNRYLKFGFEESNFEKIVIRFSSENINSEKVAIKCWFNFKEEIKNYEKIDWEWRDTKFFYITRKQHLNT